MSDNRHLINDFDLVRAEQMLDQGIPLPGLSGKYEVKEGFCAVITEGGVYKETIGPGFYHLSKYKMFRNVGAILVDMRRKQLSIETKRKYSIKSPVSVQLDLDLTVDYQVQDPRMVALEIEQPLLALYDRVNQAIAPVIRGANYEEIKIITESFGERIFARLQGMQLPKIIGIKVLGVIITNLVPLDSGEDALSRQSMDEHRQFRNWQLDSIIRENTNFTLKDYIDDAPPEKRLDFIQALIENGAFDEAGKLLSRPAGRSSASPATDIENFLLNLGHTHNRMNPDESSNNQKLLAGNDLNEAQSRRRMLEEEELIKSIPGSKWELKHRADDKGFPDGSYIIRKVPRSSGGEIICYFLCDKDFPRTPPIISLEVDHEDVVFESTNLRNWRGQYLYEIVNEVINGVG